MAAGVVGSDKSLQGRLANLKRQVDELGQKMLVEADAKYEQKDYPAALSIYERVLALFPGLPSADKARLKLEAAEKDPVVAAALREVKAAQLFEPVAARLEEVRKALPKPKADAAPGADPEPEVPLRDLVARLEVKDQAELLDRLEAIVKHCRDCVTARKSEEMLKALQADKQIMGAVKKWQSDEAVRQLLATARMYRAGGMEEKAAGYYKQLLEAHPDSDYAAEARKELAELKGQAVGTARPR